VLYPDLKIAGYICGHGNWCGHRRSVCQARAKNSLCGVDEKSRYGAGQTLTQTTVELRF